MVPILVMWGTLSQDRRARARQRLLLCKQSGRHVIPLKIYMSTKAGRPRDGRNGPAVAATNTGTLENMGQEQLNERETRAWVGFQRMRIEVNEVLARRLARDFGLTEADFVVLLRLSRIPEHRQRARDLAAALHWDRSRLSRQISRM